MRKPHPSAIVSLADIMQSGGKQQIGVIMARHQ